MKKHLIRGEDKQGNERTGCGLKITDFTTFPLTKDIMECTCINCLDTEMAYYYRRIYGLMQMIGRLSLQFDELKKVKFNYKRCEVTVQREVDFH